MLALCLMLSVTHYAQNYAGIIGGSLKVITVEVNVRIVHKLSLSTTIMYIQPMNIDKTCIKHHTIFEVCKFQGIHKSSISQFYFQASPTLR